MSTLNSLGMPVIVIGIMILLLLLSVTRRSSEKKKVNPVLIMAVMAIVAIALFKFTPIKSTVLGLLDRKPKTIFLYDTDLQNNNHIKGELRNDQLLILDRILLEEKAQCGLRLNSLRVKELAKNKEEIINAYERWRKCKDMYRSYHRVVYPDERQRIINERR